jgi:NADH dehydrogenase (ubiquinone) 1 alpha subcomplex subunit 9
MDDKDPAPGTLGYDYLDIKPDALEDVAIIYLRRYRSSAYFDQPVQSGGVKFKRSAYHVVE